jgi:hypothetical protein
MKVKSHLFLFLPIAMALLYPATCSPAMGANFPAAGVIYLAASADDDEEDDEEAEAVDYRDRVREVQSWMHRRNAQRRGETALDVNPPSEYPHYNGGYNGSSHWNRVVRVRLHGVHHPISHRHHRPHSSWQRVMHKQGHPHHHGHVVSRHRHSHRHGSAPIHRHAYRHTHASSHLHALRQRHVNRHGHTHPTVQRHVSHHGHGHGHATERAVPRRGHPVRAMPRRGHTVRAVPRHHAGHSQHPVGKQDRRIARKPRPAIQPGHALPRSKPVSMKAKAPSAKTVKKGKPHR